MSRSRNTISSLSAVQKSYFAKARENSQKVRQSLSDLDFSALNHVATERRQVSAQRRDEAAVGPLRKGSHTTPSPLNKQLQPSSILLSSPPTLNDDSLCAKIPTIEVQLSADEILEAQKRELLNMEDWCGLKSTRPPSVVFPVISDVDQIGKRRPISKEHHDRHTGQGVKRQSSSTSRAAGASKRRNLQPDNLYSMGDPEVENSWPAMEDPLPKQTSEAMKRSHLVSDLGQRHFTGVAKYSSPNSNSDENLFDYDTFDHRPSRKVPISQMDLSSQNSLPIQPLSRENVLTADNASPGNDKELSSVLKPSLSHSQCFFPVNSNARLSTESPQSPMNNTRNIHHFFEDIPTETGCQGPKLFQDLIQEAQSSENNGSSIDSVASSPVAYGSHSPIRHENTSFETEAEPTSAPKADMTKIITAERDIAPGENQPKASPFGKATLSYLNTLHAQSGSQTQAVTGNINEEVNFKAKSEDSPKIYDKTMSKRKNSPVSETEWKNFVLGDVKEDLNNDIEFSSQANSEPYYLEEPSSMDAEPSLCSPSTDKLQKSPGWSTIVFRRPPRFSGGQTPLNHTRGGSPSLSPVLKWGKLRRQSYRPNTPEEDDIED